jgi:hypothetical protein
VAFPVFLPRLQSIGPDYWRDRPFLLSQFPAFITTDLQSRCSTDLWGRCGRAASSSEDMRRVP